MDLEEIAERAGWTNYVGRANRIVERGWQLGIAMAAEHPPCLGPSVGWMTWADLDPATRPQEFEPALSTYFRRVNVQKKLMARPSRAARDAQNPNVALIEWMISKLI